jgi:hypothetical protein
MSTTQKHGIGRIVGALVGVAALAAVASTALTRPSRTPPPPPAPPAVTLSTTVLESAAAYAGYMEKAGAMRTDFKSGADVAQSLRFGDGYDPQQLLRGEIAYGAVAALQDPAFVAGVRIYALDPVSRQQMAAAILRDPAYVVALKGSDSAAGLVMSALMVQGQKLVDTGGAVKQSAYAIQHDAWSKEQVTNREQRLIDAKAMSASSLMSSTEDVARLQQAATGGSPLAITGSPTPPPYTPVVVRGMAVAALAILGQAGDENVEMMAPLFSESSSAACLNMAKLNLYQCLAVSRPHYEDVFCLGQHVLMDTGQCVTIAAGAPVAVLAPTPVSTTETAYASKPKAAKKRHHKS